MTTDRPYREALALDRVWEILHDGAGTQWDPAVIQAFWSVQARKPDPVSS